jgi:UDP-N-acetylmuramoyl-tripeptide--D-alanyl-D-alanine ligase
MQNFLNFSTQNFQKNFRFDTRHCNEKSIFIALETGTKSGTEFINDAFSNNAICTISQKTIPNIPNIPIESFPNDFSTNEKFNIIVEDTLKFMQEIAKIRFQQLLKLGIQAISITGSVGKTTTKEIIANTLHTFGKTFANFSNYNNHIGVPITILNCPLDAKFLVLEMGMNHANEIKFLTELAPCQFRLITNAKESHSGNFTNGTEGVLEAKFEIIEGQTPFELFINHELFTRFQKNHNLIKKYHKNTFNIFNMEADIKYFHETTQFQYQNRSFTIKTIYSKEQIEMICLALYAMEKILLEPIYEVIIPEIKGRGSIVLWQNTRIIDESYNASPSSMQNALTNFTKLNGSKLAILGDMLELDQESQKFHNQISPFLINIDCILVGKHFINLNIENSYKFENYQILKEFLISNKSLLQSYQNILVKSSNGTLLWKLFDDIFV